MAGSVNSNPIIVHLYDRENKLVHQVMREYLEVHEATVIRFERKSYVYKWGREEFISFHEAKVTIDLDEVQGTTELKADYVLNPKDIDQMLFLLQHNEISLARAKEVVDYWVRGTPPLSIDLPAVSMDNPLISDNDAPMDILREVREDMIKRKEQDIQDAALISAHMDSTPEMFKDNPLMKEMFEDIVARLSEGSKSEIVEDGQVKATYTIELQKAGMLGLNTSLKAEPFEIKFAGKEMQELPEGFQVLDVPGHGPVMFGPINKLIGEKVTPQKVSGVPNDVLNEMRRGLMEVLDQTRDNLTKTLETFRASEE